MLATFSKGDYERLGDRIRSAIEKETIICESDFQMIQSLRVTYKDPLADVFSTLSQLSRNADGGSIVTYRVKRIESIISKLERQPQMQLPRMADIAGCRCILKTDKHVYKLLKFLQSSTLNIKTITDYIDTPKEDGYRSLHLIVSSPQYVNKPIEIQIRSEKDHNWATLVEITDLIFELKLKENATYHELQDFHKLLSIRNDIRTHKESQTLISIANKYDYFNKLYSTFSKNYIDVRLQWAKIEKKSGFDFYLIQVSKDITPTITAFSNYINAEEEYFKRYLENSSSNIVLTYIKNARYEQISKAYSNYTLTYHQFFDDCFDVLSKLIRTAFDNGTVLEFNKYYSMYLIMLADSINNHLTEIASLPTEVASKARRKDWIEDINERINRLKQKKNKLNIYLNSSNYNISLSHIVIKSIVRINNRKYNNRIYGLHN